MSFRPVLDKNAKRRLIFFLNFCTIVWIHIIYIMIAGGESMALSILSKENPLIKDVKTYELYVVPIKQPLHRRFLSQKFLITSENNPYGTLTLSFRNIEFRATNEDVYSLEVRWEKLKPNFILHQNGKEQPVAHSDPAVKSSKQMVLIDDATGSKGVLRMTGGSASLWGLEGENEAIIAHFSRHHRLFPKSVSEKRLAKITSFEKVAARQIDSATDPMHLPLLPIFAQMILFSLESHGA
jgi:hypothetical protein